MGEAVGERIERGVAVRVVGERTQRGAIRQRRAVEQRLELVEHDLALGERARLVEADHVDAGEPLDRRELLHEHVAPGQRTPAA